MADKTYTRIKGRALVSDDDEFFRVAIRSLLLARNGFSEVIETSSLDAAVDQLGTSGPVELGLFDLNMVGMDNWLDLAAVRAEYPDMRLVVVSGSRLREDILQALQIGAHGFVHKGLGVCELSHAIELVCNGQVYVPPFLPEHPRLEAHPETVMPKVHACQIRNPLAHAESPPIDAVAPERSKSGALLNCSPRQREVIELLIAGQSNKGMARALNLSEGTIKFHMSAVLRLLGANGRVEAATRAMRLLHE